MTEAAWATARTRTRPGARFRRLARRFGKGPREEGRDRGRLWRRGRQRAVRLRPALIAYTEVGGHGVASASLFRDAGRRTALPVVRPPREYIVQSALSQQVQRLERELGVLLLKRSTHHVSLTAAGAAFLAEAQQILAHPARAAAIASRAAGASGHCGSASSTPAATRCRRSCTRCGPATPGLVMRQIEASVPEQYRQLAEEVRARNSTSSPSRCTGLLASPPPCTRGPWKASAAANRVAQGRCLYCVPSSCISALRGTTWRPLTEPASYYPWSVLWRATDTSGHVQAIVSCAQTMSRRLGWLAAPRQTAH